ncbi:MAG: metallophosphoesterase [Alphaproteobacteria bacterium]|nr:metallophosphoesterase [Alphaproteobacteria bacterium]
MFFLTLSRHTHGGQVKLPFYGAILIPSIYGRKYAEGIVEENGKKIIISRGVGTSILPIRFNCFPEIVVIYFE